MQGRGPSPSKREGNLFSHTSTKGAAARSWKGVHFIARSQNRLQGAEKSWTGGVEGKRKLNSFLESRYVHRISKKPGGYIGLLTNITYNLREKCAPTKAHALYYNSQIT